MNITRKYFINFEKRILLLKIFHLNNKIMHIFEFKIYSDQYFDCKRKTKQLISINIFLIDTYLVK